MRSKPDSLAARQTCTAIIFDFEGTLVDFQWQLAPAEDQLRRAFAELGFAGEEFSRGTYATMWNAAAALCATQESMARLHQALFPIYDRWDADALSRWAPRPDAVAVLRRLVAAGMRVGMVSNIGRATLVEALRRFDLAGLLSPVVSRDDVTCMKPAAEGILRVLARWQIGPSEMLFVGDSLADVRGARAAGIPVAIIRGGEAAETAFAENQPDHMISELSELIELVGAKAA